MANPLVSIIIPVYNGSNYIEEAIQSALNQDYSNLEILVINDGSKDNFLTENIVKKYENKVKYYFKENGGVSSALNFGIKKMKGEYFSWLSHDDLYEKNKISSQISIIEKMEKNIIIMTGSSLMDKNGLYIGKGFNHFRRTQYSAFSVYKKLLNGASINGCSLLISKEALYAVGPFDERLKYIQDWKMWVSLSLMNYNFYKINQDLVKTRIHNQQQTILLKSIREKEIQIFIKELSDYLLHDKIANKRKLIQVIYMASRLGDKLLFNKLFQELNKFKILKLYEKIIIKIYYPIGRLKHLATKLLKSLLNYKRRKSSM